MIMTSSPLLASHVHTPLDASPISSPSLRPVASTMAKSPIHTPGSCTPPLLAPPTSATLPISLTATASAPTSPAVSPGRSYARAPPIRPYQSPLMGRRRLGGATAAEGETAKFAQLVVAAMKDKSATRAQPIPGSPDAKKNAELIVDIPVWSPGCFTDLSTLHALRDTTLSHTHAVIAHLSPNTSASYRLLARCPNSVGWGCVRLAPSSAAGTRGKGRRTSFVKPERSPTHTYATDPLASIPLNGATSNSLQLSQSPPIASPISPVVAHARYAMSTSFEQAIADDDEDDDEDDDGAGGVGTRERKIKLKSGYSTASDTEDEEEADILVKREIERRGGKEGSAFVMTLHGQPALILI